MQKTKKSYYGGGNTLYGISEIAVQLLPKCLEVIQNYEEIKEQYWTIELL